MSAPTLPAIKTLNPIRELSKYGQSVWLDYIRRSLITSGELKRLVDEDGLGGVTSNPAIFEKAITGSTDYTDALVELQKRKDLDAMGIYEIMAIQDIQDAADTLRPVYDRTKMRDGYVSLEVSPFLAKDTEGTIKDARRLWKAVNRPNLMVKIPATVEGIPAIQQLHQRRHQRQRHAAVRAGACTRRWRRPISPGLKNVRGSGGDPSHVASVASFFISRIDSMVDAIMKARLKASSDPKEQALLKSLHGQGGDRQRQAHLSALQGDLLGRRLGDAGEERRADAARAVGQHQHQGSELFGRDVRRGADRARYGQHHSAATFDAFRDHGKPKASLEADLDAAQDTMDTLEKVGISMKKVTDDLVTQAVKLFAEPSTSC